MSGVESGGHSLHPLLHDFLLVIFLNVIRAIAMNMLLIKVWDNLHNCFGLLCVHIRFGIVDWTRERNNKPSTRFSFLCFFATHCC